MSLKKFIDENIKKHLEDRGFPTDAKIFIDTEGDIAYFPLYNLSGKLVGYQKYNPKGTKGKRGPSEDPKYKNIVTKENPEKGVSYTALYGLETLDKRPFVFVVEGVFDAAKLMQLKLPVVAVLANDPKKLRNFFFVLQKKVIAWIDRDKAGRKLRNLADYFIETPEPYKDLGEMPLADVKKLLISKKIIRK